MKTFGIVAEYNPFHTGHAYQIRQTRQILGENSPVVCVISGCWTQGAHPAIADKWTRARLALMGGADLILELPTLWAVSSAETFAQGSVSLLAGTGVIDYLSFGSECGDAEALMQVAHCLDSSDYTSALRQQLDSGASFAVCRQKAIEQVLNKDTGALLNFPNNNLGIEYLRVLHHLHSPILPITIPRAGAGYHQISDGKKTLEFRSATDLRHNIDSGHWDNITPYLLPGAQEILQHTPRPTADMERSFLTVLRTMTPETWAALPDSGVGEGLPDRLFRAGRQALSTTEFLELAKTKRYTHARLRRLMLWAWLGLTAAQRPATPPYLRVLGFNAQGRILLKEMKQKATLPILTKPAHIRTLDTQAQQVFELEARCTDLYDLFLSPISSAGQDWNTPPVML